MTFLQSITLGIIQGIAEFLPISSSAHLILIPWFLGWDDGGLTFDVALHAGTLVALLLYFWRDWLEMAKALFVPHAKATAANAIDRRLAVFIVISTIPGALMGLALEKKAEHAFRSPALIALNLALVGVVLWISDRKGRKQRGLADMSLKEAFIIGVAQGFAVIPGVSRAGITITAALVQGFERTAAARFSFFLSMPIIAGACILKLRHLTAADLTPVFLTGIAAAAISGYLAIGGLIRFLQTRSYGVFAAYRIVVAIAVWTFMYSRP